HAYRHTHTFSSYFSYHLSTCLLDLHSFPTRRSSDLGELQTDFALNSEMLQEVFPFSKLAGKKVNTLIFPNLDSANINVLTFFPADRKSTRLNSSHVKISYAVFCLKKKKKEE